MIGLQKSSIVLVIGGLLAVVRCSPVWSCLSTAIAAFYALLVFLKLLSVLPIKCLLTIGLNPVSYALMDFLKLKHTQINRISGL